jgi:hypothetical protein
MLDDWKRIYGIINKVAPPCASLVLHPVLALLGADTNLAFP